MTASFSFLVKHYFLSYSGLSKPCWQGIAIHFIESILSSILCFLSLYFVNILHFDIDTAGAIIACYGIGAIFGGFTGGKLSDNLTPVIVSILSLLVLALSYLALGILKSTHLLMIDIFIIGIAAYAFLTSNHLWILSQCLDSTSRLKSLNVTATISNLGVSIAAFIVATFSHYGFQYIFLCSSACCLLCACYLFYYKKRSYIKTILPKEIDNSVLQKRNITINNKIIGLVLFCVLLVGLIVSQLTSTYPIYIQNVFPQFGIKAVSILFIINSLIVVFFQTPFVNLFRNYNTLLMIGVGSFLIGVGMGFLALPSMFILAILSCVTYTLGEMIFFPMAQFVCYQKGAENKKGHSLGMFRTTYATSRALGPGAGGVIYNQWGGNMLWYISLIIGVFCLIGLLTVKNTIHSTYKSNTQMY